MRKILLIASILGHLTNVKSQDLIGLPPNKIKSYILESFMFKGGNIFFPNSTKVILDSTEEDYSLQIADGDKKSLDKLTDNFFKAIMKKYKKNRIDLEEYFKQSFPENPKINLYHTNGRGGADVQDQNGKFRLNMDYTLLESNFRASLLTALTPLILELHQQQHQESTINNASTNVTEKEVFATFLAIRDTIKNYQIPTTSNLLSGNIGEFINFGMNYFQMADIGHAIDNLEKQYIGTLLFAMAHELGHVVFGTVVKPDNVDSTWFQTSEIKADEFATLLLAEAYMILGVERSKITYGYNPITGGAVGWGYIYNMPRDNVENLLGYGLFFDKGYELTYKRYPAYRESLYPDKNVRLASSKLIFEYAYKKYKKNILEKVERKNALKIFTGYIFDRWLNAFKLIN